jgi:hypothetical protein
VEVAAHLLLDVGGGLRTPAGVPPGVFVGAQQLTGDQVPDRVVGQTDVQAVGLATPDQEVEQVVEFGAPAEVAWPGELVGQGRLQVGRVLQGPGPLLVVGELARLVDAVLQLQRDELDGFAHVGVGDVAAGLQLVQLLRVDGPVVHGRDRVAGAAAEDAHEPVAEVAPLEARAEDEGHHADQQNGRHPEFAVLLECAHRVKGHATSSLRAPCLAARTAAGLDTAARGVVWVRGWFDPK